MDVFNDWLLTRLFAHDKTLGKYQTGKVGSILQCINLQSKYPATFSMIKEIHEKRWQSSLSHAYTKKGTKLVRPTRRIKFSFLKRGRRLVECAYKELASTW
jgi:hypothetical protein